MNTERSVAETLAKGFSRQLITWRNLNFIPSAKSEGLMHHILQSSMGLSAVMLCKFIQNDRLFNTKFEPREHDK
ncbi:hypothetical protein H5410_017042 [Solanum commersonii]|uniref:Uncharacterized protein n=1 Tax=Solanum commersonii TaxID=4109 RepID=A0A9J5ZYX8_SOLCO|nr:hypothetical protein H5410_017042 [Solanum commersonii]